MKKDNLIRINQLALPILLNYLINILFETLDKIVVGHYSDASLSAVGIGASLTYVITGCFGVISNAYHIQAAEYMGKKQLNEFYALFLTVLRLAAVIGFIWMVVTVLAGEFLFSQVMGIQGRFLEESLAYFKVSSITVMLNLLAFVFSVFYRNQEKTKQSFYFTIVSTAVNIFFDVGLVYGQFGLPELGTCGAAWGSVIGLLVGMQVYIWPLRKITFVKKRASLRRTLQLFIPLFSQDLLESTVFTFFLTTFIARLGVESTAAYQLNDTLLGFMMLVSYAYASAGSTLVIQSRAAGSDDLLCFKRLASICGFSLLIPLCVILAFGSRTFYALVVSGEKIIQLAQHYLGYVLLLSGLSIRQQLHQFILQGCGCEKKVLTLSAVSNFIGILTAETSTLLGLTGIYAGLIVRSIINCLGYHILIERMTL